MSKAVDIIEVIVNISEEEGECGALGSDIETGTALGEDIMTWSQLPLDEALDLLSLVASAAARGFCGDVDLDSETGRIVATVAAAVPPPLWLRAYRPLSGKRPAPVSFYPHLVEQAQASVAPLNRILPKLDNLLSIGWTLTAAASLGGVAAPSHPGGACSSSAVRGATYRLHRSPWEGLRIARPYRAAGASTGDAH